MDNVLIGVFIGGLITLAGAMVNGFFNRSNIKLQLIHQKQEEQRKLKLLKLEELYEQTVELLTSCFWFASKVIEYSKEPQPIGKVNEINSLLIKPLSKISTLEAFYSESLNDETDEMIPAITSLQNYGFAFAKGTETDINELNKRKNKAFEVCNDYLEKIKEESKQYTGIIKKET